MKKFSKKGVLLFAAAMALCAFAMPSMASASSWGPLNSHHTLDSGNTGFISDAQGVTSICTDSQFTANVRSAADLTITHATFRGCTANGAAIGTCTATAAATKLPWTATAVTTSNLQIHGVHIDVLFENHPGSTACGAAGLTLTLTGTITNATWTGNVRHGLDLNGGHGLFSHSALGNNVAVTPVGTIFDTSTGASGLTVTG